MNIQLPDAWIQTLVKMPESGMGYQHVDIFLNGGRIIRHVTVFNCEDCSTDEIFDPKDIVDIIPAVQKP